jgi:hypothetical protein
MLQRRKICPLTSPLSVYIRRNSSSVWVAQTEYFFRVPILGGEHSDVLLQPGIPVKLPTDISEVYVHNNCVLIDWVPPDEYLDISALVSVNGDGDFFFKGKTTPS